MCDLRHKIGTILQLVFTNNKLEQDMKRKEIKPPIVNHKCVVYSFSCYLCDADYVGYTARHLHLSIVENKNLAIGKHFLEAHGDTSLFNETCFAYSGSFKDNLIVSSKRCYLSRNVIQV